MAHQILVVISSNFFKYVEEDDVSSPNPSEVENNPSVSLGS